MVQKVANRLSTYLERRAGDTLRAVIRYSKSEYSLTYLRDDIPEPKFLPRMEEVLLNITKGGPNRNQALTEEFGPLEASVHVREQGVILHFPVEQDKGVLVSLESGAARQLSTFIRECMSNI